MSYNMSMDRIGEDTGNYYLPEYGDLYVPRETLVEGAQIDFMNGSLDLKRIEEGTRELVADQIAKKAGGASELSFNVPDIQLAPFAPEAALSFEEPIIKIGRFIPTQNNGIAFVTRTELRVLNCGMSSPVEIYRAASPLLQDRISSATVEAIAKYSSERDLSGETQIIFKQN